MKIATIVGARPQFIKAAVIDRLLRATPGISTVLIHTGQHYDRSMSRIFFDELGIAEPEFNLGVGSGPHGDQTGRQLIAIEKVLMGEKPDIVLVYGDTNSTLAGALAAIKLHIPIAHVEAGLRSFDRRMPEEVNRLLTDQCSDFLFTPTRTASANLLREGLPERSIHLVGDVMYDAALHYETKAREKEGLLELLGVEKKQFVLATIHRANNTDDPEQLKTILSALALIAEKMPVVFPVHPRTRKQIAAIDQAFLSAANLTVGLAKLEITTDEPISARQAVRPAMVLIPPCSYLEMLCLERHAAVIVTDSGGVQKEAFFYRTPCVTLRDETEWTELVESKWNVLCPAITADNVVRAVLSAIGTTGIATDLYGDGDSGTKIINILVDHQ